MSPWHLSHPSFFADFYIYPIVIVAFIVLTMIAAPERWMLGSAAILLGVGFWTLVEYFLHRYLLHHVPWIKERHHDHHEDQQALIGTPTWMSLSLLLAVVLLPAVLLTSLAIGSGFTAGMMLGYLWYAAMHYGLHHWKAAPGSYFFRLKQQHALHHHFDDMGNFGVTSNFWDHIFRTKVASRRV